ncbi:REP element-mobilizing transposase RayT [Natronincola peptidivorans]|uniref:REP element-mobilizing transposase RayT n=1 Tax=Natronincola peptidivorans TaxID=426128 RepID=A0A1H9ZIZ8_9FIRM|nr:transposase [Natronincola peptidivorans]SES81618.1 REP element-mobilizing transposase RayT [Natronincola peptidivorans]
MPREPRKKSKTGIYHIMLRGIDGRDIFLEDEDRKKFLKQIFKVKEDGRFYVYGYCLMRNHVHLLVKENEEIGNSIKRITVGYVQWHNLKYGRTGHLFQNRYRSETIEDESYLIAVLRYIHQNPVKAKIVQRAEEYMWSSYGEYMKVYHGKPADINAELIKGYFPTKESFRTYTDEKNNEKFLEYEEIKKYTDKALQEEIERMINTALIKELAIEERNQIINSIYKDTGVSIRQLSRVLDIGRGVVEKAVKR